MYHIISTHYSVEEHVGYFQFLAVINKAVLNIAEQVLSGRVEHLFGI